MASSRQMVGMEFRPKPQQLVDFFLTRKHRHQPINEDFLPEANVYGAHPANTTAAFPMSNRDGEWFFFTHRSPPLGNGKRASRTAGPGRWKATQATKDVVDHHGRVIGSRQSFCYEVQSPSGYIKSDWLMEEYARSDASERLWVICKVYMTPKARAKLHRGIIGASNTAEEKETTVAPHPHLPLLVDARDPSGGDDRRKRRRTSTQDVGVVPAALVPVERKSDVGENSLAIADTCSTTGESHTDSNFLDDSGLGEFFISSPQPQLLTGAPPYHSQLVPESLAAVPLSDIYPVIDEYSATVGEASSAAVPLSDIYPVMDESSATVGEASSAAVPLSDIYPVMDEYSATVGEASSAAVPLSDIYPVMDESSATVGEASSATILLPSGTYPAAAAVAESDIDYNFLDDFEIDVNPERGDFWGSLTDASDHIQLIPQGSDERHSGTSQTQPTDVI